MAGADGFVVFQRGKESDESDIWDDTALIKAYDNAVSIMKSRLAEREGKDSVEEGIQLPARTDGKGSKKKKKKRHRPKKKQQQQWKVGDVCRAVYTEDGLLYDAEIIGVDGAAGTCTVRYTDYLNEEDHLLTDLLPARNPNKPGTSTIVSESESNDVTMQSPNPRSGRGRSSGAAAEQMPSLESYPFFQGMPFPSRFSTGHGMHTGLPRAPQMPPPPPPPPPPLMTDDSVSDDEALSSMLISWYMSGYHTGYYQGLQQGRQQRGGGASR